MAGKEQYTVAQVITALRETKGMKGPAARKHDFTRVEEAEPSQALATDGIDV